MGELKFQKYIAKYIIISLYKNIYVLLAIKNYWVEETVTLHVGIIKLTADERR